MYSKVKCLLAYNKITKELVKNKLSKRYLICWVKWCLNNSNKIRIKVHLWHNIQTFLEFHKLRILRTKAQCYPSSAPQWAVKITWIICYFKTFKIQMGVDHLFNSLKITSISSNYNNSYIRQCKVKFSNHFREEVVVILIVWGRLQKLWETNLNSSEDNFTTCR